MGSNEITEHNRESRECLLTQLAEEDERWAYENACRDRHAGDPEWIAHGRECRPSGSDDSPRWSMEQDFLDRDLYWWSFLTAAERRDGDGAES
jgi:hypothetical protein